MEQNKRIDLVSVHGDILEQYNSTKNFISNAMLVSIFVSIVTGIIAGVIIFHSYKSELIFYFIFGGISNLSMYFYMYFAVWYFIHKIIYNNDLVLLSNLNDTQKISQSDIVLSLNLDKLSEGTTVGVFGNELILDNQGLYLYSNRKVVASISSIELPILLKKSPEKTNMSEVGSVFDDISL